MWSLEECTPICVLFEGLISISAGVEPEGVWVWLQAHSLRIHFVISLYFCFSAQQLGREPQAVLVAVV